MEVDVRWLGAQAPWIQSPSESVSNCDLDEFHSPRSLHPLICKMEQMNQSLSLIGWLARLTRAYARPILSSVSSA